MAATTFPRTGNNNFRHPTEDKQQDPVTSKLPRAVDEPYENLSFRLMAHPSVKADQELKVILEQLTEAIVEVRATTSSKNS